MHATKIMDCQLFPFIFTKIKVMKRETWASQMTVISSFVRWPCTMPVSRHSCEDPNPFHKCDIMTNFAAELVSKGTILSIIGIKNN